MIKFKKCKGNHKPQTKARKCTVCGKTIPPVNKLFLEVRKPIIRTEIRP